MYAVRLKTYLHCQDVNVDAANSKRRQENHPIADNSHNDGRKVGRLEKLQAHNDQRGTLLLYLLGPHLVEGSSQGATLIHLKFEEIQRINHQIL